jgi:Ribbon-helix-helix protein, copG family
MPRILTDIPEEDLARLDALAKEQGNSRASLLREAVKLYLVQNRGDMSWIDRGFGLWADRDDIPDGVEYQRAMREDRRPYEDI